MDFIYARLNNNLVDINRIDTISLLKCEVKDEPIEGLDVGDYYLKVTVVDSDKVNYCDMSDLNADEQELLDKIYEEQQRAIGRENNIELASCNQLEIDQDEQTGIVTIKLLNIFGDVLDTKTLDLETEKIIRNITLDHQNKVLVFTLVDGSVINCDISELIDDYDNKIILLSNHVTLEVARLDSKIEAETERAESAETTLQENITNEETARISADQALDDKIENLITDLDSKVVHKGTESEPSNEIIYGTKTFKSEQSFENGIDLTNKDIKNVNWIGSDYATIDELAIKDGNKFKLGLDANDEPYLFTTGILSDGTVNLKINEIATKYEINTLDSKIDTEITNRQNADTALGNRITEETTRATNKESELTTSIETEVTNRVNAINTEKEERQAEDLTLDNKITAEKNRAIGQEDILGQNINTEIQNRIDADDALSGRISDEVTRAENAETTLNTKLNTEISTRQSDVETLQTNIDNEESARIAGDQTLTTNLDNYIESNNQALADEISRAKAKETTLETNLGNEISNREAAVSTVQSNLDSEISRATDAEGNLNTLINNEKTRAQGAEQTLTNNLNTEVTNRQTGDENLQNQIDAITSSSELADIVGTYQDLLDYDTSSLTANSIIKVLQDSTHNDASSYYRWTLTTWEYIGSEGPFYTKAESDEIKSELENLISTEESRAIEVEGDLRSDLEAEIAERGTEVTRLEGLISTEATTRQQADSTLTTNLSNHVGNKNNPHEVTKAQVGLGDVINTGDSATPVQNGTTKFTTGGAYTLKTTLETSISNEQTARVNADNALDGRVGTLEDLVNPGDEQTLAGLVYEEI